MSFLDGFQKALSGITPLRQNCHKCQKCQKGEIGGEKGISGIIGNIVSMHSAGEEASADGRTTAPTAAELAHARRMLVACPVQRRKLHCWYCADCETARSCTAWRVRRADVEFFKNSERPYSLHLVETLIAPPPPKSDAAASDVPF